MTHHYSRSSWRKPREQVLMQQPVCWRRGKPNLGSTSLLISE
jgi:hypothetical protein